VREKDRDREAASDITRRRDRRRHRHRRRRRRGAGAGGRWCVVPRVCIPIRLPVRSRSLTPGVRRTPIPTMPNG